jgi:hypothetical protein
MTATRPSPKGYLGIRHETVGSDILAVLRTLTMPEQILGGALTEKLRRIDPERWYPIETLLEPMEMLHAAIGDSGLRKMGRRLFELSHAARVKQVASSARDIIYGLDAMYHHANRGTGIGGWRVLSFAPGIAELEKTTPHRCVMEEGILDAALTCVGVPSLIRQRACIWNGAEACVLAVGSAISDRRWTG